MPMYPPSHEYSRVPANEDEIESISPLTKPRFAFIHHRYFRHVLIAFAVVVVFSFGIVFYLGRHRSIPITIAPTPIVFPNNTFVFDPESRPKWMDDPPPSDPLVLRIAVITRWDGFERRHTVREAVFKGVRKQDALLDYRFFIGAAPKDHEDSGSKRLLKEEMEKFNDIVVLDEIDDIPERVAEKRYAAVKWGGSVSNGTYDYFMTLDSDTFVRFAPLVRRMPQLYVEKGKKNVDPRKDPVLIGRMCSHRAYFIPKVPDGNKDPSDEDEVLSGPWFDYPCGIGYMLSSSLVHIMLSANPPLPHHIHYPSDDVMIGAWIASLRYFPDTSIEFETTLDHTTEPVHRVVPEPFVPYVVDTLMIDDVRGWHDFPARGGHDASVGWESTCVHHLKAEEMVPIRKQLEFLGEWDEIS